MIGSLSNKKKFLLQEIRFLEDQIDNKTYLVTLLRDKLVELKENFNRMR